MYSFLLNKEISEKTLVPCYFLFGTETFLAYQFIDELKQSLISPDDQDYNVERFNLEDHSWMEVIDVARTIPFFFSSWRIIVAEIPKGKGEGLNSTEEKILQDYFSASQVTQTVLLIIFPDKIRKNAALYKFFSSLPASVIYMKELRPLKGKVLFSWMDKKLEHSGKIATYDAKRRLAELTGNDLRHVDNEIEKIVTFIDDKKTIELDDVNQVSGWVKSFIEWEISDSLEEANYKKCLIVLNNLFKKEGVLPVRILGVIVKFFRDILMAKLWLKEKDKDRKGIFRELKPQIQEKFGPFYTMKFNQFFSLVDRISMKDLNHFLAELEKIDLKFKTSGLSLQTLLERFLYDYCNIRK